MLRIRDIMTKDVLKLSPENTLREAMEMFSSHHLSGAPVVAGDKVVGVISMTDLLGFIVNGPAVQNSDAGDTAGDDSSDLDEESEIESMMSEETWDRWTENSDGRVDDNVLAGSNLLDQSTVEEIMNTEIFSLTPDASVRQAAELMRTKEVHRVLVLKGRSLVGIVSALDVARAVSWKGTADDAPVSLHVPHDNPSPWITDDVA